MAKIHELPSEVTLSDEHLLVIQENSDAAETKKTTLALLKTWLDGLTFDDISAYFTEGTNVKIGIDNETQKITLSAESSIDVWTGATDYVIGDIVLNENTLYKCIVTHTSGDTFESTNWTALTGAQGDKGENGITPHIDETTKNWFIGETDTGVLAEGKDGVSPSVNITETEAGATITVVSGETITTADLINGKDGADGTTPHIDDTSKHWIIGEEDTGVVAEGVDGISPTATVVQTETGCTITVVSGDDTTTAELKNGINTVSTTSVHYTETLVADSWIGDTAPYTQTIEIENITADVRPIIDLTTSDDVELGLNEEKQWSYITKAEAIDGGITFYCYKNKPDIDLNFKIKVV